MAIRRQPSRFAAAVAFLVALGAPLLAEMAALEESAPEATIESPFERLFELDLEVEGSIAPHVEADPGTAGHFSMSRDLVAQGTGKLRGERLVGTLRWSLLARREPQAARGRVHLTAWVDTADGAEMFLRATGVAVGDTDPVDSSTRLALDGEMEIEFEPTWSWLDAVPLTLEGGLTKSGSIHLTAWIVDDLLPPNDPEEEGR